MAAKKLLSFSISLNTGAFAAQVQSVRRTVEELTRSIAEQTGTMRGDLNAALGTVQDFTRALTGRPAADAAQAVSAAADGVAAVGGAAAESAQQAKKLRRTLASFDEIERLAEPAAAQTASGKKTGAANRSAAGPQGDEAGGLLGRLRDVWADFWAYLRSFYAPAVAAWAQAWGRIRETALAVWQPVKNAALALWNEALAPLAGYLAAVFLPGVVNSVSQAFAPIVSGVVSTALTVLGSGFVWLCGLLTELVNTVVRPALDLALQIWQGLMLGVQTAWQTYGTPLLLGVRQAFEGLCALLTGVWTNVVQPLAVQLIALLGELWENHLSPLWQDLLLALGAVSELILTLWNTVLMPLLTWLMNTFGPAAARLCTAAAQAVTLAVAVVADALDTALLVLRGLADFLTAVFQADWNAAWNAMAAAVSAVWGRITAAVRDGANHVRSIVESMMNGIRSAIEGVLSALGSVGAAASGALQGAGRVLSGAAGARVQFRVPALASGAVIPPNRAFLALLGDQRGGTNIEAPLDTIVQAFRTALAEYEGGGSQPINIYIGEELLDSVIARSQQRRALRSGR